MGQDKDPLLERVRDIMFGAARREAGDPVVQERIRQRAKRKYHKPPPLSGMTEDQVWAKAEQDTEAYAKWAREYKSSQGD